MNRREPQQDRLARRLRQRRHGDSQLTEGRHFRAVLGTDVVVRAGRRRGAAGAGGRAEAAADVDEPGDGGDQAEGAAAVPARPGGHLLVPRRGAGHAAGRDVGEDQPGPGLRRPALRRGPAAGALCRV